MLVLASNIQAERFSCIIAQDDYSLFLFFSTCKVDSLSSGNLGKPFGV
jgi:hypothetical protein